MKFKVGESIRWEEGKFYKQECRGTIINITEDKIVVAQDIYILDRYDSEIIVHNIIVLDRETTEWV